MQLINYHYSYLVGTLIFIVAWLALFTMGKRYRRQMLWGSLVSGPLAFTSFLFIPQYWTPPSLFNLDARFRVGIEDVLWAAAVGGIASAIGEILLKEKLTKSRGQAHKRHYFPFLIMGVVFVTLELVLPGKTIYNTAIAFAVCACIVAFLRHDLIPMMLVGGAAFTGLYWLLFEYFLLLYPDFIARFYNVQNLSGIDVFRVPIEELMFASSGGTVWSVAYEYIQGYRFSSRKSLQVSASNRA